MPEDSLLQQQTSIGVQKRRKHPFRRSALEKYQRASDIDTPELTPRWHRVLPLVGITALILAALLW